MSLKAVPNLRHRYRTGRDSVVRDFYVPCLTEAKHYSRAVGYFSSAGLTLAAKGLAWLVRRGGSMRLVASPHLSEEDIAALDRAHGQSEKIIALAVERSLAEVHSELAYDRLAALEWLVRNGALEVRLAIRVDAQGRVQRGLYHEKFGILEDANKQRIAFAGSSNETEGGLVSNFESIHVFRSWSDPDGRVEELRQDFESLWDDKTPGLSVRQFTDTARELLRPYARGEAPENDPEERETAQTLPGAEKAYRRPIGLVLAQHQEDAVGEWLKNKGRGIFAMATGAGKTIAALACIDEMVARSTRPVAAIVVAPYLVLLDQWEEQLRCWNAEVIRCAEGRDGWHGAATSMAGLVRTGEIQFGCLLTTNRTFMSAQFQGVLRQLPPRTIIVADEMHNLGANRLRSALPESIKFRLGLSATPDRRGDAVGSDSLAKYFGAIVSRFTLRDALNARPPVLCPYDYWPTTVELSSAEAETFLALSAEIVRLSRFNDETEPMPSALLMALMRRARLIGAAEAKIPTLLALLEPFKTLTHTLVYCGDGSVELDPDADREAGRESATFEPVELRQVEAAAHAMTTVLAMNVATYTSKTSKDELRFRLKEFERGNIQALVAIRCLDEGVDIPAVRRAFILASSTNPRQFIQRRGRVLRRAPGKEKADIFDMIVAPPRFFSGGERGDAQPGPLRRLVEREFERIIEFADLAQNAHQARAALLPLVKQLQLEYL